MICRPAPVWRMALAAAVTFTRASRPEVLFFVGLQVFGDCRLLVSGNHRLTVLSSTPKAASGLEVSCFQGVQLSQVLVLLVNQWLTACCVTPNAAAIFGCVQFRLSSARSSSATAFPPWAKREFGWDRSHVWRHTEIARNVARVQHLPAARARVDRTSETRRAPESPKKPGLGGPRTRR